MFDLDAALDPRPNREACRSMSASCERASASSGTYAVRGLPADRILWSRGEVIALRRRAPGRGSSID